MYNTSISCTFAKSLFLRCILALCLLSSRVELIRLKEFFPYGITAVDLSVPLNDDGSSGRVSISSSFPFFDNNYDSLFVNTNGALSFKTEVSQYTPNPFPLGDGKRLVAPFWGDVDTTRGGTVWYRESVEPVLLERSTTEIRAAFVDHPRFKASWLMIATWDDVAFYGADGEHRKITNTFQLILVTNGRHSFAIFNYHKLEWTTGTASHGSPDGLGGTPAQAGFNAGDGLRFFNVPGSMTSDVLNLTRTSNVDIPGKWIFRIDDTSVEGGGCNVGGSLTIWPSSGNMLGGENIFLAGPCYNKTADQLVCKFNNQLLVAGTVVSGIRARCIVPMLNVTGRIPLQLSVNGGHSFDFKGVFTSVPINRSPPRITRGNPKDSWIENNPASISWNINEVGNQNSRVSIQIVRFENDHGQVKFHSVQSVIDDQENSGQSTIAVGDEGVLTVEDASIGNGDLEERKDDRYVNLVRVVSKDNDSNIDQSSARWIWSDVFVWTNFQKARDRCNKWHEKEPDPTEFTEDPSYPPCPLTLQQALVDRGRFIEEKQCSVQDTECSVSRDSASYCFSSTTPSAGGAGDQCCYNHQGNLMIGPGEPDAGSLNRVHVDSQIPVISHFSNDQVPYQDCCKWSDTCDKFFEKRPSDDGSRYQAPRPATGFGDPHIITLDGVTYTFNGYGEYTLLRVNTTDFTLQARMQPLVRSNGALDRATVYTAFAMKENGSDVVQIHLNGRREVELLVNGEKQSFEEQLMMNFKRVIVIKYENSSKYSVMLHSGISMTVEGHKDLLQVMVMVPVEYKGNTSGLMGYWDDNKAREFLLPNGEFLDTQSNMATLHFQFGQKWNTTQSESLFTYDLGKGHSFYAHPEYSPVFLDEKEPVFTDITLEQEARAACGNRLECLFDIHTTGKVSIGQASKEAADVFVAVINDTEIRDVCAARKHNCTQTCMVSSISPWGYNCSCRLGFELQLDRVTCNDSDECASNNGGCSISCINVKGSYRCACPTGFMLTTDQHTCKDIDECTESVSGCSQECTNTVGGYKCYCQSGYRLSNDNHTCEDINECRGKISGCQQECVNTVGSYACHCRQGFLLAQDNHTCQDICDLGKHNCSQVCIRSDSSRGFNCSCRDGFRLSGDATSCSDIDECTEGTSKCTQGCTNIVGAYTCYCRVGFLLKNDNHTCQHICETNSHNCSHICSPSQHFWGFNCSCAEGYALENDGTTCQDVNECSEKASGCSQECNNSAGGYECYCREGYQLTADNHTCQDIDECKEMISGCSHECNNTVGSYECYCKNGFNLINDKRTCEDINECQENTNRCSQECNNTIGGYKCYCKDGYRLANDNHTCEDTDECQENTSRCSQECNNTIGGYQCYCKDGYSLANDSHTCEDNNECEEIISSCSQECNNTVGSYACYCRDGFYLTKDKHTCEDINECQENTSRCSQECNNTIGGYKCYCKDGYRLANDNHTCEDTNECQENTSRCSQECNNTIGGYQCYCKDGYSLANDSHTCEDIDECKEDTSGCSQGCSNTVGSYKCYCEVGFYLNKDDRTCDVNESTIAVEEHAVVFIVSSYNILQWEDGKILFQVAIASAVQLFCEKPSSNCVKALRARRGARQGLITANDVKIVSGYPKQNDQDLAIAFYVLLQSQHTILSQETLLGIAKAQTTLKSVAGSLGKNLTDIQVQPHVTDHTPNRPPEQSQYKKILLGVCLGLIALALIVAFTLIIFKRRITRSQESEEKADKEVVLVNRNTERNEKLRMTEIVKV